MKTIRKKFEKKFDEIYTNILLQSINDEYNDEKNQKIIRIVSKNCKIDNDIVWTFFCHDFNQIAEQINKKNSSNIERFIFNFENF